MPLIFSSPSANVPLGAGGLISITIPSGPVPIDDYVSCTAYDPVSGASWPFGDHVTAGLLSNPIVLGVSEKHFPMFFSGQLLLLDSYEITAYQSHADNTLVDTSPSRTFHWDPYSGLFVLMQATGHDSMLDDILGSVRRTFPGS